MKKQTSFTVVSVAASCLLAAGSLLAADDSYQNQNQNQNPGQSQQFMGAGQEMRASKLIGKSVKDSQGQTSCEIKDLVVDLNTGRTRYAIVNAGGVAGMGGKRIAVPINSIQASSDGTLTIAASKQDLESASATPTGAWASASGQEWTKDIQGYYGEPQSMNGRFEREFPQSSATGREPVRNATDVGDQLKGAEQQQMGALQDNVNQAIRQSFGQDAANGVQANVDNGTVTLTGTVSDQATKDSIESKVQSLPGVQKVKNKLSVEKQ